MYMHLSIFTYLELHVKQNYTCCILGCTCDLFCIFGFLFKTFGFDKNYQVQL